jgi:hypothetical protein
MILSQEECEYMDDARIGALPAPCACTALSESPIMGHCAIGKWAISSRIISKQAAKREQPHDGS